jgi:very-short-patch-repair endonuclease
MKYRSTTQKARDLRKTSTDAERLLWKYLQAKRLNGLKFRRQEPIGTFIVDFVCFEKSLIVEVDGGQHVREKAKDEERTKWLEDQSFKVLRFWNNDVMKNVEGVLRVIQDSC